MDCWAPLTLVWAIIKFIYTISNNIKVNMNKANIKYFNAKWLYIDSF